MCYPVWFGTKNRKRLLIGDIGPFVEKSFLEIAAKQGLNLVECKCFVDHAHLLIEVANQDKLPKVMQLLKGGAAYRTFQQYPGLNIDDHTNHLWRVGYGFREVPTSQVKTARQYILTQELRPEKFDW